MPLSAQTLCSRHSDTWPCDCARTWLIIKVLTKVLKGSTASDVREEDDSDADEKED
jgi:hypothetical protein